MSFEIPLITSDSSYTSIFSSVQYPQHTRGDMLLTDRIDALNLRLRISEPGYQSDWHIAGDPTLIVVQQGTLRIILRNNSLREFKAGDSFIAADYLPEATSFDTKKHGHRAEVVGNEKLIAVHIKLAKRPKSLIID